ncbi:MAG: hypothetical protein H6711_05950 [Myxococcales bacterium]|nr:hypothetical protein [Myxococcales bacterium]
MTSATPPRDRAARRRAVGERLLADEGVLWSALPVEWPRQPRRAAGARDDEDELPGWRWRVIRTLWALLRRPRESFADVQEPVAHSSILAFLYTVRIPVWLVTVVVLGLRAALGAGEEFVVRPIDDVLDPHLVEVLGVWILLMVPIGLPLLYFFGGLLTHVALALTGGAPRSIAASMRATGYAMAAPLAVLSLAELPLYLGVAGSFPYYLVVFGLMSGLFFRQLARALAGTHRISLLRGILVAIVPLALFAAAAVIRLIFVLQELPGWSPPPASPYLLP